MESTLHLVLRLRGGGELVIPFPDIEKEDAVKVHEFDPRAPDYRRIRKGMYYAAYCYNPACAAGRKADCVAVPAGFGIFNLQKCLDKVFCPACHQKVKPYSVGWHYCDYQVSTQKPGAEAKKGKWHQAGDKDHRFDNKEAGEAEFVVAIIEVVPYQEGGKEKLNTVAKEQPNQTPIEENKEADQEEHKSSHNPQPAPRKAKKKHCTIL